MNQHTHSTPTPTPTPTRTPPTTPASPSQMRGRFLAALRAERRGTFLVLVVGTLAMLSIIMIVYVAVGNADQRSSTGIARRNRSNEVVDAFAQYIGQVIADDVTAIVPDRSNSEFPSLDQFYTREAWDVPRTAWNVNSSQAMATSPDYFTPYGRGDDPWLASTTPAWINYNPQQNAPQNTDKTFTKRVDWLHISNLAPDGRFVNLANLRDSFGAEPGIGGGSATVGGSRMSTGLTLYNPTTGNTTRNTVWNENTLNSTLPAHFDSWQAGAFLPAQPPFKNGGTDIQPSDTHYPPNQWADADGDGFFDSRWFEMVDARGGNFNSPLVWNTLVPADPSYRWVFAARVIDLSALVNVNVATDLNANPNDETTLLDERGATLGAGDKWKAGSQVLGRSPAEVDLRRLLTMRDFRETILGQPASAGTPTPILPTATMVIGDVPADNNISNADRTYSGGYSGLRQPLPPAGGSPRSVQDYALYSALDTDITALGGISAGTLMQNDLNIGLGAYRALRGAAAIGRAPARFSDFTSGPLAAAAKPMGQQELRWQAFSMRSGTLDRPVYRANPSGTYLTEPGFDFGFGFRTDALIELLTYRGTNDPAVTSSLETAMGGRASSEFTRTPNLNTVPIIYSPLRENRSLELERSNLSYASGKPTEAALLKSYTDLRQYLTTMSGARPLMSRIQVSPGVDPNLLAPSDLSTEETSIALTENTPSASIFRGYVNALMPGMPAGVPARIGGNAPKLSLAWDDTDPAARDLRGLFYGHQGPLTALLTAAHMAANYDSGSKLASDTTRGQPYVLVLSEDYQADIDSRLPTDVSPTSGFLSAKQYFPAWWQGRQFNLARPEDQRGANAVSMARIPETPGTPAKVPVPAVNVYGTGDLHPFLVGVATYTVYRDTYHRSPLENSDQIDREDQNSTNPAIPPDITINGQIRDTNPDFLFRLVAVQMHNPHSVPVRLTSDFPGTGPFRTDGSGAHVDANLGTEFHYLRFGSLNNSKFYVLAEVRESKTAANDAYDGEYTVTPVIIAPGETIVFYALSRERKRIVEERFNPSARFSALDRADPTHLEEWLENQLGPESDAGFRRIQMLRVEDAAFGAASPTVARASFSMSDPTQGVLVPPASDNDDSVALFRSVRVDSGTLLNDAAVAGLPGPNGVLNDAMRDRIQVNSTAVLDRQLRGSPGGMVQIENSIVGMKTEFGRLTEARERFLTNSGPQRFLDPTSPEWDYNSRLTVALCTFIRRPSDPLGVNVKPGQIPAWAIEPKDDPTWNTVEMVPPSTGTRDPIALTSANFSDVPKNTPWSNRFASFLPTTWKSLPPIFEDMTQPAGSIGPVIKDSARFESIRRELASNGNGYRSFSVDTNPDPFQARPIDLLGVLGVGPYETPVDETGTVITDPKKRWTTTAEALAIALGYSAKPTDRDTWKDPTNNYGPLDYYFFDRYSTAVPPPPLYDGGYLKLNDYACVRIDNTNAAQPRYYSAGNGAPIAGNVLTAFRTAPDRFASLTVSTPGLVNINTAPSAVLRVLPLAFPAEDVASTSTNSPKPTLWPAINGTAPEIAAQRTDIAAMIESYRDKIAVELRPGAKNPTSSPGTATPHYSWFAPFLDRDKPGVVAMTPTDRIRPSDVDIGVTTTLPGQYKGGRYWTTGITGIREEAGFRSLAELLALRSVRVDTSITGGQADGSDQPINIDFLGHVGSAALPTGANLLGIDSVLELTADTDGSVTDAKPLQFANTNQDRLKILAALSGSVTVRSDMYAAWFVVRGYQRSDVEGLADDQPMVPSIERRFLMIIDRSNVTKPGQRPRVVSMVEVPL